MPVSPEAVLAELKAGRYAPLYVVYGEEPFYVDQLIQHIENHALNPTERSFNQTVLYGRDVTVAQVLEAARRFPMMAMRQVVVVKEAQEMADLNRKPGQEMLTKYAAQQVPTTVLVIGYKKKLDGRTEMFKALDKHAILVETKKIYDNKLPQWVADYCKSRQYPIQPKATTLIAEYIGNDLSRIANEIEKVLINYPANTEISTEMVMQHVGISKEYNVFELQAAIGKRDRLKALQIVHYFAANPKEHPLIPMLSVLYGYFAKILLVHQHAKASKDELAKKIGVSPYFVSDYLTAANHYSTGKAVQAIRAIHQTDLRVKGIDSDVEDGELLKELVCQVLT